MMRNMSISCCDIRKPGLIVGLSLLNGSVATEKMNCLLELLHALLDKSRSFTEYIKPYQLSVLSALSLGKFTPDFSNKDFISSL